MNTPIQNDQDRPRDRSFWTWTNFRDVSLGLLMIVIAIRMAFATTNIDLSGFNFTDLLSLILAISAIGLSAAFYFKADESARDFYDNTYNFTKDVSVMLGRIESGFGEKLAHINEGYAGLNRRFDNMPSNPEMRREEEVAKKAVVEENEQKVSMLLEDLMLRAQMPEDEKQDYIARMDSLQKELDDSRAQLALLKSQEIFESPESAVFSRKSLSGFLVATFAKYAHLKDESIRGRFNDLIVNDEIPPSLFNHMRATGMVFGERLTDYGVQVIRSLFNQSQS
jgi:hypothetical protein